MKSISNILNQKKDLSPLWKGVNASLIVEFANKLLLEYFGQKIAESTKAVYYKNTTLTIATLSSVISQEIKLREKEILQKINHKFGQNMVNKIRYLA